MRWAVAEARHHGFGVLDNPTVSTPGWFPVDSWQLDFDSGLSVAGSLELAIEGEFEPQAKIEVEGDAVLRDVGLLLHAGPRLPAMHESKDVKRWRRDLAAKIRVDPESPWSRHEQALFASLERDRAKWPNLINVHAQRRHIVEWGLRTDPVVTRPLAGLAAAGLADTELEAYRPTHDLKEVDVMALGRVTWAPPSRDEWPTNWNWGDFWGNCRSLGWDTPVAVRAAAIYLSNKIDDQPGLADLLRSLEADVEGELGTDDANYVLYVYMINITRALAGEPLVAREQIEALIDRAVPQPPYALPIFAAIHTLCGDYQASAEYLQTLPLEDPQQFRLYLANLLAAGHPEQARAELQRLRSIDTDPRDYLGPQTSAQQIARELLLARLHAY
ncbi:MAG: tetratricopeptide repeat protein [Myxococcales bacterium]|nr:tetratricopeptide repeat protein [Myxococcales bacterium]